MTEGGRRQLKSTLSLDLTILLIILYLVICRHIKVYTKEIYEHMYLLWSGGWGGFIFKDGRMACRKNACPSLQWAAFSPQLWCFWLDQLLQQTHSCGESSPCHCTSVPRLVRCRYSSGTWIWDGQGQPWQTQDTRQLHVYLRRHMMEGNWGSCWCNLCWASHSKLGGGGQNTWRMWSFWRCYRKMAMWNPDMLL